MLGDIKTFDYVYGDQLTLQITAIDLGDGTSRISIKCTDGQADINAIYWNDGIADGNLFDLGTKKDNSLNMNGTGEDWDGGLKLSSTGIGPMGDAKPTFLQAGEEYPAFVANVAWGTIDTMGVRATSTSTDGGSIKGVDGDAVVISAPKASVGDVTVCEGEDLTATVKLTLSEDPDGPYPYPVTVYYDVVDNSAKEDGDYDGSGSYSHTFPAGSTSFDLTFPITNDDAEEPTENFHVNITNVVIDVPGADLESASAFTADGQGVVTILDKDQDVVDPPPPPPVVDEEARSHGYYKTHQDADGGFSVAEGFAEDVGFLSFDDYFGLDAPVERTWGAALGTELETFGEALDASGGANVSDPNLPGNELVLAREAATAVLNYHNDETHNDFVARYKVAVGQPGLTDAQVLTDLKQQVDFALDADPLTGMNVTNLSNALLSTHE